MVFGMILLVASDALAKLLVDRYPVAEVVGIRASFVVVAILLTAQIRSSMTRLLPVSLSAHLLRAVFAVLSSILFVLGLSKVSLIDASAASYTGPLFLTSLAPWLLGERVGRFRWTAVVIGFLGTLIMLRPSADGLDWPLLLPALAALCGALRDITTRRISVNEDSMSILMTSNLLLAVVCLSVSIFNWTPLRGVDLAIILLSGALIAIAHFMHIEAFRYAEAATVAPYRYTSIIWSALLSFYVWGDQPDAPILIGGTIVIGSGLAIFYRERHIRNRQR